MFLKISLVILISYFCVSIVHCWDLAVTTGNKINLIYKNGSIDGTNSILKNNNNYDNADVQLQAITYDPIDNRLFTLLLLNNNNNHNQSSLIIKINNLNDNKEAGDNNNILLNNTNNNNLIKSIQSLHYEVVTKTFYWIENEQRIIKMNLLTQQIQPLLLSSSNLQQQELTSLAIHSCQQYIFWANITLGSKKIQRSTLSGDNIKIIINNDLYFPSGLTVDERMNRIYWTDDTVGDHYVIESSNLNGDDRQEILHARHQHPFNIIKLDEQLLWIDNNEIWTFYLNNNTNNDIKKPHQLAKFNDVNMIQMISLKSTSHQQCTIIKASTPATIMTTTSPTTTTTITTTTTTTTVSSEHHDNHQETIIERNNNNQTIDCLNNGELYTNIHGNTICKCSAAYMGDRCQIPVCHNFCMSNGTCTTAGEGSNIGPQCLCPVGYTGLRCEINKCNQYCLNDGQCTIDVHTSNAHCTCLEGFSGERCQTRNNKTDELCRIFCEEHFYSTIKSEYANSLCNCVYNLNVSEAEASTNSDEEEQRVRTIFTKLQDPFVIVLIVLVIILIPINMALTTTVCWLKKRPRIKRRIIVNKNVTPLTSRPIPQPDQCEITIENCCNMNICETPCFEPPQLRTSSKSSKTEEKKTLLSNMENNGADDFY